MEQAGLLRVVCEYPEAAAIEDHLIRIKKEIEEFNPDRVAIDSLSALERVASDKSFREFVIGLTSFIKHREIPGLYTATTSTLLGGTSITETHISTITDSIILLRYVEKLGQMRRGLAVLKMRGSHHDKDIREFTIDENGLAHPPAVPHRIRDHVGKLSSRRLSASSRTWKNRCMDGTGSHEVSTGGPGRVRSWNKSRHTRLTSPPCAWRRLASESRFQGVIERNADGILVDLRPTAPFVTPTPPRSACCAGRWIAWSRATSARPIVPGETTEIDLPFADGETGVAEMRVVATEWEGEPGLAGDSPRRHRAKRPRSEAPAESAGARRWRTGGRTSSWRCWPTSCAIRWRRSATPCTS